MLAWICGVALWTVREPIVLAARTLAVRCLTLAFGTTET
jgi:hypothetical protein